MARTVQITEYEIQQARKLRDEATTVAEYRKALSTLLIAEPGFDAEKAADLLGMSRRTIFRNRSKVRNQDGVPRKSWGGRRRF